MYKLIILVAVFFGGCSTHYEVNGAMCDRIAMDPKATVPCECRVYLEEKAAKASRSEKKLLDTSSVIKFEVEDK